jgi:molybdopterin synthase sulfur carrier subunit
LLSLASLLHNSLIFQFTVNISGILTLRVSVRFFTSLREITGKKEATLEFSDDEKVTVEKVLGTLSSDYGAGFVEYVFDAKTQEVKGFLQFLINGQSASTMKGLQTELKDGDVLAILPPVGGG